MSLLLASRILGIKFLLCFTNHDALIGESSKLIAAAESPLHFVFFYILAYLILQSTDSLINQSIFWEPSTASSGMSCSCDKVLAAIVNESDIQEPIRDPGSPVQSCSRLTEFPLIAIGFFPVTNQSPITDRN